MGRNRIHNKFLPQRVYLRSGSYYFVDYTGSWHNLGRSYPAAMAHYGQLVADDAHCRTMGDVIDRYTREIVPTKAPKTAKENVKQARYLRVAFGDLDPRRISTQGIYQYMDARGKQSTWQANRELALFSHMFRKAIRWGIVSTNPCIGVERFPEPPRARYVEDQEFEAFREFAGPLIAAYLDFKLLTGLRQADILSLRLDQLKEDGIHVLVSKTKKPHIVQWSPALRQAVETAKALRRQPQRNISRFSTHLFCTRVGKPYTADGFRSIWQRKMRKAHQIGVLSERFTDHDIRAKTGSDADPDHASRLLAHTDPKTTQRHYRRKAETVKPLK